MRSTSRRRPTQRPSSAPAPATQAREVEIAAMGAQGDGVAEEGGFVPFTLPGERVQAGFAGDRGELLELLRPSSHRAEPPCPHFFACGGCALQHWAHEPYLQWKAEQVRLALARERLECEMLPAYAAPPWSRRRFALHARRGAGPNEARLGYKARRSWDLVEIETCPISDRRLVEALPALRRLAAPFLEHPKSAPTLHVTLTETGLDVDVTGVERKSGGLSAPARRRAAEAASAAGFARVTMSGEVVYGARPPVVRLGPASVTLPPGAFLQAVPGAEAAIAADAVEAVAGARRVLDLFCGVGTFSFRLAERATVHAVDSAPEAVAALRAAVGATPGLKALTAEVRDLDRRPVLAMELKKTDAAVFDPPRAGAAAQAAELARAPSLQTVVGVSCNPATFARDARLLVDGGFTLARVRPVDQFLWSPHMELVGVFIR
ncbi:MAG: RNA methyltransferase [Proteobacteria bacterium]|nr:RNA methyltransferase [Pseudomonadota bacterium]